jgi:kynurenine 3-monooxygenase
MADTHYNEAAHIMIVGAGLAGALLACALGERGYRVSVYERRPDPRIHGFVGGRSINLALSTRGITALAGVGLDEMVLEQAIPMRGRMMHAVDGVLTYQRYSANPNDAINSVDRGQLNLTLLEAASTYDNVSLHFLHRCLNVDLDRPMAVFEDTGGSRIVEAEADVIIGADGAFSAIRSQMQRLDRFNYSQSYLEHGYKELVIPAAKNIPGFAGPDHDGFAMEPNALHIWPRGGFMMIALPNQDRTFTCTCFWPFSGPTGFSAITNADQVLPFFERHFPDAVPLMPTLVEDYMANPTSSLVTIRCAPWHYGGKVVLVGDAAHAIVPFYGQGMNAAFEDCRLLVDPEWHAALETYSTHRKADADAIADMALDNFIEMRDKVGSRIFLAKKKLEKLLHRVMPETFMPLYNLVSFTNVPYARARRRVQTRNRALAILGAAALAALAITWAIISFQLG